MTAIIAEEKKERVNTDILVPAVVRTSSTESR